MSPSAEVFCRFVTSFATTADEVDRFAGLIALRTHKKAAPFGAAFVSGGDSERSGCSLRLDLLGLAAVGYLDLARLQLLGNRALQIDVEQAVLQLGAQTSTWSASWKRRSKVRAAMPR